jgi:hypothetical protein
MQDASSAFFIRKRNVQTVKRYDTVSTRISLKRYATYKIQGQKKF